MFNFSMRPSVKGLTFDKPSLCQKHLAKMCDIRTMISRALAGDSSVYCRGSYADVSNAPDNMQDALNIINRGREAYYSLSDEVRAVYPSPEVFLAALHNPDEAKRLVSLGVVVPSPKSEPVAVRVISDKSETTPSNGVAPSNN